ncbi:hypothetical protein GMRT_14544 [Giardia muris]|uniref:Uncharacterized protein n=1 Tax=Giardia muris TaxID=5742 RepID=A0A4Z1SSZ8_GIAMU|nr:hypothetical protein GMRT_14544 [Giardia muris]|eukprot:TNJ29062.1 hypothetical protein GMRT_14544 [Giardia muris]
MASNPPSSLCPTPYTSYTGESQIQTSMGQGLTPHFDISGHPLHIMPTPEQQLSQLQIQYSALKQDVAAAQDRADGLVGALTTRYTELELQKQKRLEKGALFNQKMEQALLSSDENTSSVFTKLQNLRDQNSTLNASRAQHLGQHTAEMQKLSQELAKAKANTVRQCENVRRLRDLITDAEQRLRRERELVLDIKGGIEAGRCLLRRKIVEELSAPDAQERYTSFLTEVIRLKQLGGASGPGNHMQRQAALTTELVDKVLRSPTRTRVFSSEELQLLRKRAQSPSVPRYRTEEILNTIFRKRVAQTRPFSTPSAIPPLQRSLSLDTPPRHTPPHGRRSASAEPQPYLMDTSNLSSATSYRKARRSQRVEKPKTARKVKPKAPTKPHTTPEPEQLQASSPMINSLTRSQPRDIYREAEEDEQQLVRQQLAVHTAERTALSSELNKLLRHRGPPDEERLARVATLRTKIQALDAQKRELRSQLGE